MGEGKVQGQGSAPSLHLLPQLLHWGGGLLNVLAVPRAVLRPERSPALLLAGCKNWSREWKRGKDPGEGEVAGVAHESRKVWDKGAELGTNWLILIATHHGAFPFSLEFCLEKNKFVFV